MILLTLGAEMLARLMGTEERGPDTAWLLFGPEDAEADEPPPPAQNRSQTR